MRVQNVFRQRSRVLERLGLAFIALLAVAGWSPGVQAADSNRIVSISVDQDASLPEVKIQTKEPVGYRYTVYDSFDPLRVVVDFPGMDIAGVASPIAVNARGLKEVKVSSYDLTSGKLARVELLLEQASGYNVLLAGNELKVVFDGSAPKTAGAVAPKIPVVPPAAPVAAPVEEAKAPVVKAVATSQQPKLDGGAGRYIETITFQPGKAIFQLDAPLEKVLSFELTAPPRLVVDFYGAKPRFKEQSYDVVDGFRQVRVGTYEGKTRFVFDAADGQLPEHTVDREGSQVVVGWSAGTAAAAAKPTPARVAPAPSSSTATIVQSVDFTLEGNNSVLTVGVQGSPQAIQPAVKNGSVQFGIENASISKALRRAIDTSAFPSAVSMITPLTERSGDEQDVLFNVDLRGAVPFRLEQLPGKLRLVVENGEYAFAQPAPAAVKLVGGPMVSAAPVVSSPVATTPVPQLKPVMAADSMAPVGYTGEKISLVFDDADTRKILQLIGEVSNLNIIAGDDIQGTITLRLVDVPWDQALDLIMDIKGLGMIREGNVARIMPKEKLRAMDEAKMTAARAREKLEDLTTEVITISYADLGNVAEPAKKLLTERGKITEDKRNKQLIITDISSSIAEIRKLISLLDTPEKQVLIEARIVEATTTFSRDLGVKWGVSHQSDNAGNGSLNSANLGLGGSFLISPNAVTGLTGTAGLGSALTFGRLGVDSTILDLRISALETSGHGKVISTPRVTTMNGSKAVISQGTEIPYQSTDDNGKTETEFKKAELSLTVTPEINPDGSIFLQILAKNDSRGADVPTGLGSAPAIDTKTADTKVLVRDGETTVIGGIFVEEKRYQEDGVPYLMRIPILGHFFKSTNNREERRELLVFITPRILNR